MIKSVIISASHKGGAGTAAYRLHQGLMKSDREIINPSYIQMDTNAIDENAHLFAAEINYNLCYRIKKKFNATPEAKNSRIMPTYPGYSLYEIATFPTSSYRIEEHPLVQEADIVNIHWVGNFLNYPSFFKNISKPIVWTLHDMNAFQGVFHYQGDKDNNKEKYGAIEEEILQEKRRYIHQNKDIHIVTPSKWLGDISAQSETLKQYPHHVIPYGMDIASYPYKEKQTIKDKLKLNNSPTLLFVAQGVDIHRKGFDILSSAFDKLSNYDFNLITVGGTKIAVNEKINHIHYDRIHEKEKINELYIASDMTIIPSREDNLPNVMLESLMNGTPVLALPNTGMKEYIQTGYNGILVEETNSDLLADALNDFISEKYKFNQKEIVNFAKANFDDKMEAENYINLYKSILNR